MLKNYFICLLFLSLLTEIVRCEPKYSFNFEAGVWLKLHKTPETWEKAFLKCHKEGAVLASPLNKELANVLHSKTRYDVNANIYLGTHDLFYNGYFASIEGVPLSLMETRWDSEDNVVNARHCLTMSVDGRVHYSSCTESLPFICYRELQNETINECGTFDNEYHLNQQTGSCYKVHPQELSWTDAYGICASEGGHLVILNDEEEARIVKEMFPVNPSIQFHIGLVAWGDERIWSSIHGHKIEDVFNHWNTSQPDNYYGTQDRASYLRNGFMDDVQKWTTAMFVCEKYPESPPECVKPSCLDQRKGLRDFYEPKLIVN